MPAWNPAWGAGVPPRGAPNPYYDRNASYGWSSGTNEFETAPISQIYQQTEPGVAYTRQTAPFGGGLNAKSRFIAGQEQRAEDAYKAAVAQNPNLQRPEFFSQFGPEFFQRLWQQLGPRGRGEQQSRYAPGARWQRWG